MRIEKKYITAVILFILLLILAYLFYKKEEVNKHTEPIEQTDTIAVPKSEIKKEYGLAVDSLFVIENKIKNGENLSVIFSRYSISPQTIDRIVTNYKDTFDVRKIIVGNIYKVFCSKDSVQTPLFFIYEKDYENYVVIDFSDSLRVYNGKKEIQLKFKILTATIQSSLYNAMVDADASPGLAIELADVYTWTIDFFSIQKGDKFKMIYEEKLLEGKPIGFGKILSACFTNNNENFYAIYFEQDRQGDYFDENGKALRRALLKAPLQFSRISSRYNVRRYHPILEKIKPHLGTDYAAPIGTPVVTVGDGVVLEAQYKLNNGNYVKIKHNSTYTTGYLHLSKIGKGIYAGAKVKQGQVIGYVGSTGLATGPHLCYRFWKNGEQVDALRVKIPPSEPVKEEYLSLYNQQKDSMMTLLNEGNTEISR